MEGSSSYWNDEERLVAESLLLLARTSESFSFTTTTWGCKRRRSAVDVPVWWPRHNPKPIPSKAEEASSPATPLSFAAALHTESEDKDDSAPFPPPPPIPSLKKKKEHYLQTIQDLKKRNGLLSGEIDNVKGYFERVKDFNLKLKARKFELSDGAAAAPPPPPQIRGESEARDEQTTSLDAGKSNRKIDDDDDNVDPTEIPDLNLPPAAELEEECGEAALDDSNNVTWAFAAQAQQNVFRFEGSRSFF